MVRAATVPDGHDPLGAVAELPGVPEAVDAARAACEELRWHEAYRRRWREVRAEAGIRSARASAALDGARVPLDLVRSMAVGAPPAESAEHRTALGALRAAAYVEQWMPALAARGAAQLPPLGQLVAGTHRAATGGWLPDERVGRLRGSDAPEDLRGLGVAVSGAELAARLDLLGDVVRRTNAPALVVTAVVHGELLALRPFAAANGVVARAVARLLLTARGLDPTGSVVPDAAWAAAPNPYLAAAAGFATGTPDGVARWVRACADAVVIGAGEARVIGDAVLAGRLAG
ncbi:cell filamentation protein Fic [Cellulomonas sp. P22]|uniref:cell filamentation protein Fic n=1 Tax=Cellulomonas sp. P22 TaxID=3373189 RepID=UPI0037B5C2B9